VIGGNGGLPGNVLSMMRKSLQQERVQHYISWSVCRIPTRALSARTVLPAPGPCNTSSLLSLRRPAASWLDRHMLKLCHFPQRVPCQCSLLLRSSRFWFSPRFSSWMFLPYLQMSSLQSSEQRTQRSGLQRGFRIIALPAIAGCAHGRGSCDRRIGIAFERLR
jgi:hypothetical protein